MIKRIVRFRIRFVLIVAACCAVLFSWACYMHEREKRESAAIERLFELGPAENISYTLESTIPFPSLQKLVRRTGLREPFCVRTLVLRTTAFSDRTIDEILAMDHLTHLALIDCGFSDEGLARLSTLDSLEVFKIHKSTTRDDSLPGDRGTPFADSLFNDELDSDPFGDKFSIDDDPFAGIGSSHGN